LSKVQRGRRKRFQKVGDNWGEKIGEGGEGGTVGWGQDLGGKNAGGYVREHSRSRKGKKQRLRAETWDFLWGVWNQGGLVK